MLRREKNISQKQVALELGISQALLSHYEKGIRECGLDFVVKAADYYDVSCDYLLGRSADRSGLMISPELIPEPDSAGKDNMTGGGAGLLPVLNKKLISNSLNILFDILGKIKCKELTSEVSAFLMMAFYRMFRVIYSGNSKNPMALFSKGKTIYRGYSDAGMNIAEANAAAIVNGNHDELPYELSLDKLEIPNLDTKTLSESYPLFSSSLLNLIKNTEDKIKDIK
ncbi:MAG: helix-turn-helix transcriptional regulator [Oscillospiraceae bacterium]